MFGTIRRHSTWLWVVIIILVIISFVWYMGPSGSPPSFSGAEGVYGFVNGQPIGRDRFMQAYTDARIQFYLYAQTWPEDSPAARQMFDAERQVAERLVVMDKLDALEVRVDDKSVARYLAQVFQNRETGSYDPQLYDRFVSVGLRGGRVGEEAFLDFVRREVAMQHLMGLGGMSGLLVTPREAEVEFRRANEQVEAMVATFSQSNFLAQVNVTPESLTNFFNLEAARYRVPEKVRVSYVRLATTNFWAEADTKLAARTNLNAELEAMYLQRGANSFRTPAGESMPPEEAKEQLKGEFRDQLALFAAHREATAFGEQLLLRFEENPGETDQLEKLAADQGLPSGVTEPFTRFERPLGLLVGSDFAPAAFDLNERVPMSMQPLEGQDGVYLIALKERVEGYVPPLDQVRPEVIADFRRSEARRLAREAARDFAAKAATASEGGEDFKTFAEEAQVSLTELPPFSSSTRSLPGLSANMNFRQLQPLALELEPGEVSEVEETSDGALLVYLVSRQPVEEERVEAELAEFTEELRAVRRREALTEWLRKEIEVAQVSNLPEELRRTN